jgi:hypothetical protein
MAEKIGAGATAERRLASDPDGPIFLLDKSGYGCF